MCLLIFGAGNFVIPAMICITIILLLMKKFRKGSDEVNGKNMNENSEIPEENVVHMEEKGEVEHV